MQDIIFYVSAKEALGVCKDSLGIQETAAPAIILGSKVRLRMRLLAGDGTDTPLPIDPLAACVSWEFVMDSDWNKDTPLKVVADNANIVIATVAETDSTGTEHTYTEAQIPVTSIDSEELQALLTSETATLNAELAGYDANAELSYILQIKGFTVRNRIAASGPPTETADLYLKVAEAAALLAAKADLAGGDFTGVVTVQGNRVLTSADIGAVWHTITYAAAVVLEPANGPRQKIGCPDALALTSPALSADMPELSLQIDTGGYAISLDSTEIIAAGTAAVYLLSWYWDGATTRRRAVEEVY